MKDTQKKREHTDRREITEGDHRTDHRREIKGATRDADPKRNWDRSET
jgi:hypothetical protein